MGDLPIFPLPPSGNSSSLPSRNAARDRQNAYETSPRLRSLSMRQNPTSVSPYTDTHLSPTSPTFSMRRISSFENAGQLASRSASSSYQPAVSSKESPDLPTDPLLRAARMKMSSKDAEEMRKLRSTMVDLKDGPSFGPSSYPSSTSSSPYRPNFPADPAPVGGPSNGYGSLGSSSRGMRSRRSTLSRLVTTDKSENQEVPPKAPEHEVSQLSVPAQYVIAVIGHAHTGKTTLINRAFKPYGVTHPVNSTLSSGVAVETYHSNVFPAGKIQLTSECQLIELDIKCLRKESVSGEGPFPPGMPAVNGALITYDSRSQDSFIVIPELIQTLAEADIPTIIFATKSDPSGVPAIQPEYANSFGQPYNVGLIEVTDETGEGRSKMRNGVRYLLLKMEGRLLRQRRKASRPSTPSNILSPASEIASPGNRMMWGANGDHRRGSSLGTISVGTSAEPESKRGSVASQRSSSGSLHWIMQSPLVPKVEANNGVGQTTSTQSDVIAVSSPNKSSSHEVVDEHSVGASQAKIHGSPVWASLDDLYNQLFAKLVSTQDPTFVRTFFMTYRRFCSPRDLIFQFLNRLREIEGYDTSRDVKHWALQKLTGAIIDWTLQYPGDLADALARDTFQQIIAFLLKHTFMAHLTAELALIDESLAGGIIDIDASWSLKPERNATDTASSAPSTSRTEFLVDGEMLYDFDSPSLDKSGISTPLTKETTPSSHTMSTASIVMEDKFRSRTRSDSDVKSGSSQGDLVLSRSDDPQNRWSGAVGYLLTVDPKLFATELTKLQWQVFSSIRPRDVFRHDMGKERDAPIGQAIAFFNRVARWVATIVLADPKPKHRARIYERFMLIAHHLRRLNNYESLYAVLSGMDETSITRLAQTHALIQPSPEIAKSFASHRKLMSTANGYMHYKRALQADRTNGKATIPLLMMIFPQIVRMQAARPDDIRSDGMVQWEKFQQFEEILRIIPDCQTKGSMVAGPPSNTFVGLMNDTPIIEDEDELYARSKMLEPAGLAWAGHGQPNVLLKKLGKMAF